MKRAAQHELQILTEIAEREDVTQRRLSDRLGIALGLTNLYLKRLGRKGYIKVTTIPPKRIKYLLTPKGLAEKTRLTYDYMDYSLRLYRETRRALRARLESLTRGGGRRVLLVGAGEAAELAYLTIREVGLELTGVVDEDGQDGRGQTFLGLPVRALADLSPDDMDFVIVATFGSADATARALVERGIPGAKIIPLRGEA